MIELIVAIILAAIMFGVVGTALVNALQGSSGVRAGGVADASARRVSQLVEDDVARAETKDRADGQVRDLDDFNRAVRNGDAIHSTEPTRPATASDVVDIRDVRRATGTGFTIQADVIPDSTGLVECVEWDAATKPGKAGSSEFTITRTVKQGASEYADPCSGTVAQKTVELRAHGGGINSAPFSYQLQCHQDACGAAASPAATGKQAQCMPWPAVSVPDGKQLAWIVGVKLNLAAIVQDGGSAKATASSLMTIRSRSSNDYQLALGC